MLVFIHYVGSGPTSLTSPVSLLEMRINQALPGATTAETGVGVGVPLTNSSSYSDALIKSCLVVRELRKPKLFSI